MITEAEYQAIKAKFDAGELPSSEEMAAITEFVTEKAKAELAVNPAQITCKHCGAQNTVAAIEGIVVCEWCGEPLLMEAP